MRRLMDLSRNVALTIIFTLCILVPALVFAVTGHASIGALGRNPSAAPKILPLLIFTARKSISNNTQGKQ